MDSDKDKILLKLQKYCSWRDRCIREVEEKLHKYQVDASDAKEIINALIQDKYLDEKRFTESFVHSKLTYNKWGRIKIKLALHNKRISNNLISDSLNQIDQEEYQQIMLELIKKKKKELDRKNAVHKKQKIYSYLTAKGFEPDLIYPALNRIAFIENLA